MMPTVHLLADSGCNPVQLQRFTQSLGYEVRLIERPALLKLSHSGAAMVLFPGGWYSLNQEQKQATVEFVRGGGGCVGVCAGAYQVAGYIPLIPGRVLRCGFRGRVYLEPVRGDHPVLCEVARPCTRHQDRRWEPVPVTHMGGPFMFPEDRGAVVATYDTEGELPALLAAEVGAGRAVAIASHPECREAPLPPEDPFISYPHGDPRLILANALRWVMKIELRPQDDVQLLNAAGCGTAPL
jgi:hypothetical protein